MSTFVAFISGAGFGTAVFCLWMALTLRKRLKSVFHRLHRLENAHSQIERQLVTHSRALCAIVEATGVTATQLGVCQAQHGEELYLWELCGWKRDGVFVEIGAYDGISLSNSLFFERLGWNGLMVEAHPDLAERCRQSRPNCRVVHAALGESDGGMRSFCMVSGGNGLDTLSFASTSAQHRMRITNRGGLITTVGVPARTLSSVLREHSVTSIDWMSIDVEGGEWDVLRGVNLREFRPRFLIVEDNSGGGDTTICDHVTSQGYQKILRVGCNDIYQSL